MFVDFNILNQLGSPSINSNTFANRPAAGQTGRLFVSTDTFEIFRDNGTGWDLIGGPGAGTITGTGTATQVAYFTGSQTIGSSANLFWDNTAGALGINTATPGAELDIHGTGIIVQVNSTSATANSLLAFQRSGSGVWRIGDQYNGGSNFFELHNTVLTNNAIEVTAANNKSTFTALETYASGLAIGNQFTYNLTVPNGVNITSPNAVGAVNSYLNLSLGGNTTVPVGARQGLEGNSRISFTGAGTLTMTQGSTVRAFSALSSVYSFAGSAVGTVTHLAGLRICFPDNIGSAINITNNYGLLLNDQTTGTGTVTYTNRWGIYQEGASDLNYFAANMLLGSTTNSGQRLQVTGTALFTGVLTGNANINGLTISNNNSNPVIGSDGTNVTIGSNQLYRIVFSSNRINLNATDGISTISSMSVSSANNGSVYIGGNANPSAKLQVAGSITAASLLAQGVLFNNTLVASANNDVLVGLDINPTYTNGAFTNLNNTGIRVFGSTITNNTTPTIEIRQPNATSTSYLSVRNQGFYGTGTIAADFGITGSAGGFFTSTAAGDIFLKGFSQAATSKFFIGTTSSNQLILFTSNNVGVGTSTDAGFRLDCNGSARIQGATTLAPLAGYSFSFSSAATALDIIAGNARMRITGGNSFQFDANSGGTFRIDSSSNLIRLFYADGTNNNVGISDINDSTFGTNASAVLALRSTTKGFLPPRMTGAQAEAIGTPAAGLMVYANNGNGVTITSTGWWGYDGATWVKLN